MIIYIYYIYYILYILIHKHAPYQHIDSTTTAADLLFPPRSGGRPNSGAVNLHSALCLLDVSAFACKPIFYKYHIWIWYLSKNVWPKVWNIQCTKICTFKPTVSAHTVVYLSYWNVGKSTRNLHLPKCITRRVFVTRCGKPEHVDRWRYFTKRRPMGKG